MSGREWKREEIRIMKEMINDNKKISSIAKKLDRSEAAVRLKATRIGIEIPKYNPDLLSMYALSQIMDIEWKTIERWTEKGLKVTRKGNFYLFKHKDIIRFLKDNQELWDATRGDMYIVNGEPWFQAKYEADKKKKIETRNQRKSWNHYEVREIVRLRDKGWNYEELAKKYGRSRRACRVMVCAERKRQREEVGRI